MKIESRKICAYNFSLSSLCCRSSIQYTSGGNRFTSLSLLATSPTYDGNEMEISKDFFPPFFITRKHDR